MSVLHRAQTDCIIVCINAGFLFSQNLYLFSVAIKAVELIFFNRVSRTIIHFNRALIAVLTHISFVLCYTYSGVPTLPSPRRHGTRRFGAATSSGKIPPSDA